MCHPEVIPGQPAFPAETDEVVIPTPEGDLPALLARPGSEAVGGILLFHDVFGRTSFYEDLAAKTPRYILDTAPAHIRGAEYTPIKRFPRLEAIVSTLYTYAGTIDNITVYERRT